MRRCLLKDRDSGLVGPMEKHLASPIKQIVLAGIQMSGRFEIRLPRRYEFVVFLVDLAEQVVQFAGVFVSSPDPG